MLTPHWTPLKYHPLQSKLWRTKAQFVAVAAGRGSGKTMLARMRVVRYLPVKKPWPDPVYFYGLPTINQARRLAWEKIINLIPKEWIKKVNISDMSIRTVFGSTLYILGMDSPHRAEGLQYDGGILDESCDQKPKVFDLTILPALTHRDGWCWRIGVPKRHGIGSRDFKRFYDLGCNNNISSAGEKNSKSMEGTEEENNILDSIKIESYTWPSSDILSPEKLAWYSQNLDPRDFNEQFNASWESASGAIFYAYVDKQYPEGNLDDKIVYRKDLPLVIGMDFNVDPMAWIIGHKIDNKLHVFDEIFIRNTNTPESLVELHKRYGDHPSGFHFFGDASGRARKTSASSSDYLIIVQWIKEGQFKGGKVHFLPANPRVQNRFAACNAMFCNAKGERRATIHPRCKHLRQDIMERQYKEGTNEPDDYGDIGHISDALGYPVHMIWPISVSLSDSGPNVTTSRLINANKTNPNIPNFMSSLSGMSY